MAASIKPFGALFCLQVLFALLPAKISNINAPVFPLVLTTWYFTNATDTAYLEITKPGKTVVDAVVKGCTECEREQCDGSVGYGSNPDESGETTLDAMVMDGQTHDVGSVGDLRRVKNAIGVARAVMDYTDHTLIVGESATKFAREMGFKVEDLTTNRSREMYSKWKAGNCQPNYWHDVHPDPRKNCGPYKPGQRSKCSDRDFKNFKDVGPGNHDTIGMIVVDENNNIATGTSTNGLNHKVAGRVGDSPIVGAGSYASAGIGGAAATGDGDKMMRFLPSFHAVMLLKAGMSPEAAAQNALKPIIQAYPNFMGALIVAKVNGFIGAACHGLPSFPYSFRNSAMPNATINHVPCI